MLLKNSILLFVQFWVGYVKKYSKRETIRQKRALIDLISDMKKSMECKAAIPFLTAWRGCTYTYIMLMHASMVYNITQASKRQATK